MEQYDCTATKVTLSLQGFDTVGDQLQFIVCIRVRIELMACRQQSFGRLTQILFPQQ
jgi:hypothetical protein